MLYALTEGDAGSDGKQNSHMTSSWNTNYTVKLTQAILEPVFCDLWERTLLLFKVKNLFKKKSCTKDHSSSRSALMCAEKKMEGRIWERGETGGNKRRNSAVIYVNMSLLFTADPPGVRLGVLLISEPSGHRVSAFLQKRKESLHIWTVDGKIFLNWMTSFTFHGVFFFVFFFLSQFWNVRRLFSV